MKKLVTMTAVLCLCAGAAYAQGYSIIHDFDGITGASPRGNLLSDGSTLYGLTYYGGQNYDGTVFSMAPDGSGFTVLHDFGDMYDDGIWPWNGLIADGSTLYGTASYGGSNNYGTIFSIGKGGTGYTILHNFDGVTGASPRCNLLSDGSTLYGTTYDGGSYDSGTVFSIGKDGSNHTMLHEFGGQGDAYHPTRSLVSDGSALYGTTSYGVGYYGRGTIFSVKTDGSGFTVLHQFDGVTGATPRSGLITDGSKLYGTTGYGGTATFYYYGAGTVFSMNTDGTDFTLLHEFEGGAEGWLPYGALLSEDGRLFGTTIYGGGDAAAKMVNRGQGTIFSVRPDGTNFTKIRSFTGGPDDGAAPSGSLISDGTTLYGTTTLGGQYYQYYYGGTVFSMPIPTPVPEEVPGLMSAQIWVDKDSYTTGDTQLLSYELINPLHALTIPVDAYLALRAPDGRVLFYGPLSLGRGLLRFTTAMVPVTTIGRVGTVLSGTAAQFTVPPMQTGTWTWMGVVVPAGANPANPDDRLSNMATDTFEFTQ